MSELIKVVIKRPGSEAEIDYIENELEALQNIVGGYIETVTISQDAVIICNEEGRLIGLPYNCTFCGVDLVGTILVAGVKGEEFTNVSLELEDLRTWFTLKKREEAW